MTNVIQFDLRRAERLGSSTAPISCVAPDDPPHRGSYKSPERAQRYKAWQRAETIYEFYDRLGDFASVAVVAFERAGLKEAGPFAHLGEMEHWHILIDKRRAARAALMLTPAPTAAALNRKKAMRASPQFAYCPIDANDADASIDADAAWLKANARKRVG